MLLQVDSFSSRVRTALGTEAESPGQNGGSDNGAAGGFSIPRGRMGWPMGDAVYAVAQHIASLPAFATSKDVKQVRAITSTVDEVVASALCTLTYTTFVSESGTSISMLLVFHPSEFWVHFFLCFFSGL